MYTRAADNRIWSRPIILLPTAFFGDPASRHNMPANGGQVNLPDTPENQTSLSTAIVDTESHLTSNAFMTGFPFFAPTSDAHMDGLFSANNSTTTTKLRQRKNRRGSTKNVVKAEDIPEYKGQMPVDDLVNFINSGTSKKGSTKKNTIKSNVKTVPVQSNSRRAKEKSLEMKDTCSESEGFNNAEVSKESISNVNSVETEISTSAVDSEMEDIFPTDSTDWEDFTIVRRKKKGKMQYQVEDDNRANNSTLSNGHTEEKVEINSITPTQFARTKYEKLSSQEIKTIISKSEVCSDNNNCNSLQSEYAKHGTQGEHLDHHVEHPAVFKTNQTHGITKNDNQYSVANSEFSNIRKNNHSVANFKSQRQPVVFADRSETKFAEIDVSFGFSVQDFDSGFESTSDVDILLYDSCSCMVTQRHLSAINSLGKEGNSKLATSHSNCADTDVNYSSNQDTDGHFDTTVNVSEMSQMNISSESEERNCVVLGKQRNKKSSVCVDEAVSFLEQNSTGAEFDEVQISNSRSSNHSRTKTSLMSSNETSAGSLVNSKCTVHNPCSGKPVSIVTPNQPLKSFSSSSHKPISNQSQGAKLSQNTCAIVQQESVYTLSPCTCTGSRLGHNLGHNLSCSPTSSSCGQAPILKVAPMLVEHFDTSQADEETVDSVDKEVVSRRSIVRIGKEDENEQESSSNLMKYKNPQKEITETKASLHVSNKKKFPDEQICSATADETNSQDYISPKDKVQSSKTQSHCLSNHNIPPTNNDERCAYSCEETFLNDIPACQDADVHLETIHCPIDDTFDLLSAQIFLYKSYEDCISATYAVLQKVQATDHHE